MKTVKHNQSCVVTPYTSHTLSDHLSPTGEKKRMESVSLPVSVTEPLKESLYRSLLDFIPSNLSLTCLSESYDKCSQSNLFLYFYIGYPLTNLRFRWNIFNFRRTKEFWTHLLRPHTHYHQIDVVKPYYGDDKQLQFHVVQSSRH